jgi:cell division protease FtsH
MIAMEENLEIQIKKLHYKFKRLQDSVNPESLIPEFNFSASEISYTRFLEMLSRKQVKRVWLLADGRFAIAEKASMDRARDLKYDKREELSHCILKEEPDHELLISNSTLKRYLCELPGDAWDNAVIMSYIKKTFPSRDESGETQISELPRKITFDKYGNPTSFYRAQLGEKDIYDFSQTSCKLVVIDPNDSNLILGENKDIILMLLHLLLFRIALIAFDWFIRRFSLNRESEFTRQIEKLTASGAKEFNLPDARKRISANRMDTGVRFQDVAGIDSIKNEILDILSMMKGEVKWNKVGAKAPRGILLTGPPGTGKTLLAKAMAGEAGIPFFSTNGAQFIDMYPGLAAARVRDIFSQARKHTSTGAIIFIDEIDSIALARKRGGDDSCSTEREQGLLQLLVEMDGFRENDRLLVVGATNLVELIDNALMRPGRFDRIIHMSNLAKKNRLEVLKVHSRDKKFACPISKQNILHKVSEITAGYSGAELANILNEASILMVRERKQNIDYVLIIEAVEKVKMGLFGQSSSSNLGKLRFALTQVAKAVCMALTPIIPTIEWIIIRPRNGCISRISTQPFEQLLPGTLFLTRSTNSSKYHTKQPFLSDFEIFSRLLIPFYAARAFEEVRYGPGGVSLSTSNDLSIGAGIAHSIVTRYQQNLVKDGIIRSDTTIGTESLVSNLIEIAYLEAKRLVIQRTCAVEKVANMLLSASSEMLSGDLLIQSILEEPISDVDPQLDANLAFIKNLITKKITINILNDLTLVINFAHANLIKFNL